MEEKFSAELIVSKPFKNFPKHTKDFMNKVNERAKATHSKYVGVIDEVFYEFYEKSILEKTEINAESWKKFHQEKFDTTEGKIALRNKLSEMKANINLVNDEMINEWYDFFLYEQTFFGKHQEFLIKEYFEELGLNVEMSRPSISSNTVDLIVNNISIQVKPDKFRLPSQDRSLNENVTYIYYKKEKNKVSFLWESKELDDLIAEMEKKNANQNNGQ